MGQVNRGVSMKTLLAAGMGVVAVLVIATMFAMIQQQDNTQLEAAPSVSDIAIDKCLLLRPFFYHSYYSCY